jgi:hypothetical protein
MAHAPIRIERAPLSGHLLFSTALVITYSLSIHIHLGSGRGSLWRVGSARARLEAVSRVRDSRLSCRCGVRANSTRHAPPGCDATRRGATLPSPLGPVASPTTILLYRVAFYILTRDTPLGQHTHENTYRCQIAHLV